MNREERKFWLMIFLTVLLLIISVFSFIYFSTTCSVVKENPYIYAAKTANADYCSCYTESGTLFFNQTSAWKKIKSEGEFNFNIMKGGIK